MSDPVDVIVVFDRGRATPHRFRSGGRVYDIKHVNLIHSSREGRAKVYTFSVSDDINSWQLRFNTDDLSWHLDNTSS